MIRYSLSVLLAIAWALWFGGLITLFLAVTQLSHTFVDRREIFGQAGSGVFNMFERYQLVVGGIALVAAFGLRMVTAGLSRTAMFCLLGVAAAGAVVSPMVVTPKIDALRLAGKTQTAEFKQLHGRSMMVYSGDALVLAVAGIVLPGAIAGRKKNDESRVP